MKLAVLDHPDEPRLCVVHEGRYVAVDDVASRTGHSSLAGLRDVSDLLRRGPEVRELLRSALAEGEWEGTPTEDRVSLAAPVLHPRAIVCVGLNYTAHIEETRRTAPDALVLFAKFPSALTGSGTAVAVPSTTSALDYEGELVAVVGSTARNVEVADAMDHVAGWTIMNDLSARDLQRAEPQWIRAKSSDGFAPLGPCFVERADVPDWTDLRIVTRVNGEVRQDALCSLMVTGVPELIAYISRSVTLEPGDLIATGTPAGVALGMDEPAYLRAGDTVTVDVAGIGTLVTTFSNP
ncbi:2-keto-4-pentenoate hydratase/2-oxohepta-3-ene-1,7-dioic acid hydratase in catechol pathway [Nocardioides zeae]|uniref:2-keto-4-pentenoate hydratase/2-oxohepta-3-ene-1,7-dioic acid hydratase in catechol pathway n=1 Tax=Nocardioides zeae TaxID=1457234 RepID=A0ACC6IEU0_9ACTN|nr:fumarylacetoacetate hydrolase family protein [Nocardioides zeae]MDR6174210.1 2-keto-4-pentenoate hydratase/2-oxohepta-3-ene-1,7-dioic acid hydratase in catechol pathway [Nocardioides zeae]MDR6209017.1 2-keto-4-pentenoate hydratase/2-oxohepta-3-ene-1,7-dioic acid hydratase in catechol pathway [Nocardioides zeae]